DVPDGPVVDGDREDLRLEALPAAGRAGARNHELLELGLDVLGVGLAVAPLEVRHEPLERRLVRVLATVMPVGDDDPLVLWRSEEVLDRLRWKVAHRRVERPAVR